MSKEIDNIRPKDKENAFFIQRLLAFIIDMILVTLLSTLITYPFLNIKEITELEKTEQNLSESFQKGEINLESYVYQYSDIQYKLARNTGFLSIVTIMLEVLYFILYQTLKKGQTFGKKLLKIRVVSDEGELFINQMIFRTFIANFLLVNIISFMLMLFCPKDVYFYGVSILDCIQYFIIFISCIMIMNRKNGLAIHDRIVHTKVIKEK